MEKIIFRFSLLFFYSIIIRKILEDVGYERCIKLKQRGYIEVGELSH